MQDLEIAKQTLKTKSLSLVIVKDGRPIFESRSSGIIGLLQAVEAHKEELKDSSVADRVAGRAAALLLAYSHVKEVYAVTVSNEGLRVFQENQMCIEYDAIVPKILDRTGKDICPFEKLSLSIVSPQESYDKLKQCVEELRKK